MREKSNCTWQKPCLQGHGLKCGSKTDKKGIIRHQQNTSQWDTVNKCNQGGKRDQLCETEEHCRRHSWLPRYANNMREKSPQSLSPNEKSGPGRSTRKATTSFRQIAFYPFLDRGFQLDRQSLIHFIIMLNL